MGLEAVLPFIIVFGSVTVGIFVLVLLIAILKSYVKAPANRAFVRTGGFRKAGTPPLVVMNGGAWVFKAIHENTWVDLGTMAVEIERTEENALLTKDPQYADIRAIFYIKVDATTEGISKAARTIGDKEVNTEAVKQLVDAKLDGALRDVAATFTLMSLHGERESFIEEVQTRLKGDLDENGLALESVSILTLKSARQGTFPTDDVFGAQVARANAQVIQTAMRERNDIVRQTEVDIKQRNVSTEREKLSLDRDLAFATAEQEREVRIQESLEKTTADKTIYEQDRTAEQGRIAKERAIKLSEIEMEQTILVENEHKAQEHQAAEIARTQAIEVAEQEKQVAILKEQENREAAERERLVIAAQREEAAQAVLTVEETSKAQRESRIQIIEAERDAQREMIERKNAIELNALREVREAKSKAEALKEIADAEAEAALKQAETKRTQAKAESDAEKMIAEAVQARSSAEGLAEAQVIHAKADAEQAQAEAIRATGLAEAEGQMAKAEALAAFDSVAHQLEMERLRIDAQIKVGIAQAEALGQAIANMQIKLFGSPAMAETILRMTSLADGLGDVIGSLPEPVQQAGKKLFDRVTGGDGGSTPPAASPEQMADLLPRVVQLIEERLDAQDLENRSVAQVIDALDKALAERPPQPVVSSRSTNGLREDDEKSLVAQVRQAMALVPFVLDMPFEDVYLRYSSHGEERASTSA